MLSLASISAIRSHQDPEQQESMNMYSWDVALGLLASQVNASPSRESRSPVGFSTVSTRQSPLVWLCPAQNRYTSWTACLNLRASQLLIVVHGCNTPLQLLVSMQCRLLCLNLFLNEARSWLTPARAFGSYLLFWDSDFEADDATINMTQSPWYIFWVIVILIIQLIKLRWHFNNKKSLGEGQINKCREVINLKNNESLIDSYLKLSLSPSY